MSRSRDERGSATLFVVSCVGVLLLLGTALGVVAAMVHAHRAAQSASDLAALAAATALGEAADPCGLAARIATANGATLTSCTVSGREVRVEVEVAGPRWLGQAADLAARSRAGPA